MATWANIIADVAKRLPYSTATYTDAVLIGWGNDIISDVWRYCASTKCSEFPTASSQQVYSLSTSIAMDKIISVQVGLTTSSSFTSYKFAGSEDILSGLQWYDALESSNTPRIGLYPIPDTTAYTVRITYESMPPTYTTSDTGVEPAINREFHNLIKFGLIRDIAGSGKAPDVILSNNYEKKYQELFSKMKMNYYKRKSKLGKNNKTYRDSWYNVTGNRVPTSTT